MPRVGDGRGLVRHGATKLSIFATASIVGLAACSPTPPPESPTVVSPSAHVLDLPRVPWEGGPQYWEQFPGAREWTSPSFFPIGIWYNNVNTDDDAAWDKKHGVNTYAGLWEGSDFSVISRNGQYWLGDKLNSTFDTSSPNWPGVLMDDEVDGRFSTTEGHERLERIRAQNAGNGKFMYANYTQMVIGQDLPKADQETYVNLTDAVSMDQYWYTLEFCDWTPYRGMLYADPIPQNTCRTASSYGKAVNSLTIRDEADGKPQPRWMFIENLNGGSTEQVRYISPGQLKGAAMSSVINEARGLMWFNQSLTGDCRTSNALRDAQLQGTRFCGYAQMEAMGEVNNLIRSLAKVLNTQSYEWNFGVDLDTMLKIHDDTAYVFAMADGTTGERTFNLPSGISGTSAQVVDEKRSIDIVAGSFSDSFAHEYDYHIYRIRL